MRAVRFLPLVLVGCLGGRPMDGVFIETGFGEGCWVSNSATGLARTLEGDVQVVITPDEPGTFTFSSAGLVSGGKLVEETVGDVEAVFRVTPTDPSTAVVFTAQLACSSPWSDTASPPWTYAVMPSSLTTEWSVVSPS